MARYKYIDTNPRFLPVDLARQLLPGTVEHAVHHLLDHAIDLSAFDARFRNDDTGAPADPPAMLLKVVLSAYAHGIVSSRGIARACQEHVTFIALSGDRAPHFTTIAHFVSTLGDDIAHVFAAVLAVCGRQGLIGREMVAIDGVKLPSNASKQRSGTRADVERQATKMEAAASAMLSTSPEVLRDVCLEMGQMGGCMRPIRLDMLSATQLCELDHAYRTARDARLRIRALMVLLAAERRMVAAEIAAVVRQDEATVRRWLLRYAVEGLTGLSDAPRSGVPPKVTRAYREQLLAVVRRRPRALDLPFSRWTGDRLADYLAEQTGVRMSRPSIDRLRRTGGVYLNRPPHPITSPDPEYALKKKRSRTRATT